MSDPYQVFFNAAAAEKRARDLDENEITPGHPCGISFNAVECRDCNHFSHCEKFDAPSLFQKAWQGYKEAENLLRTKEENDPADLDLLAEILLAIHIHPRSGFARDTAALGEAHLLWLQLYENTNELKYLRKAQFCDDIREAVVVKIE